MSSKSGSTIVMSHWKHGHKIEVGCDHKFIGFDGYQKAMDSLRGDVVILATPPAFRWVHFGYAIQKGIHTFMRNRSPSMDHNPQDDRPRRGGNIKVGVGLTRHCQAARQSVPRISNGEIGHTIMLGLPPNGRLDHRGKRGSAGFCIRFSCPRVLWPAGGPTATSSATTLTRAVG